MNFAGSIVDNFIMLRFLHPQELILGRSTLQKRTSWLPKLVIYLPVQSWFRNSEVLCKITSHTVHSHDTEAAILKNLQWKTGKGAEANRVEWEFTNGTAIFRSFLLEREKRNTSEDFHLFRKLSGGMSCTIWISNRNFRFLLTNGKRPRSQEIFYLCFQSLYLIFFLQQRWLQSIFMFLKGPRLCQSFLFTLNTFVYVFL